MITFTRSQIIWSCLQLKSATPRWRIFPSSEIFSSAFFLFVCLEFPFELATRVWAEGVPSMLTKTSPKLWAQSHHQQSRFHQSLEGPRLSDGLRGVRPALKPGEQLPQCQPHFQNAKERAWLDWITKGVEFICRTKQGKKMEMIPPSWRSWDSFSKSMCSVGSTKKLIPSWVTIGNVRALEIPWKSYWTKGDGD